MDEGLHRARLLPAFGFPAKFGELEKVVGEVSEPNRPRIHPATVKTTPRPAT